MEAHTEPAIRTERLTKRFGPFTAVRGITFSVSRGEIFGFLGANGAGKTTAMRMLCGLSRPTSGRGWVAGYDIDREPEQVKRHIGYMSQRFSLYGDLTVRENLRLFGGIYGMKRKAIAERGALLLEELGMTALARTPVAALPLGWRQRLAFSVATLHSPEVVFLDEPTGGVDPATRRRFWELIGRAADRGTTIFVTTHYMDEAEYCDRLSIMAEGEIRAIGTPGQLRRQMGAETMDEVFRRLAARKTDETRQP